VILSPARTHAISADSADLSCASFVCSSVIRLDWLRRERGSVGLALSSLKSVSGGGDFGLFATLSTQPGQRKDLLQVGRARRWPLHRGVTAQVTLWWAARAQFRLSGFVWTGRYDDAVGNGTLERDQALIDALVSEQAMIIK